MINHLLKLCIRLASGPYPIPGSEHDLVLHNIEFGADMTRYQFTTAIDYAFRVVDDVRPKSISFWEKNSHIQAYYEKYGSFVRMTTRDERMARRLTYEDLSDIIVGLERVYRWDDISPKASKWVVKQRQGYIMCWIEIGQEPQPKDVGVASA